MTIVNAEGKLSEGMRDWSLAEFDSKLVQGFSDSVTRPLIATGYSELVRAIADHGLTVQQWLDGSFCIAKADPGDLDLVTILDKDTVDSLPPRNHISLVELFDEPVTKTKYQCDSYVAIRVPESHPG
ncbi:MAG: hypothetical protein BZY75_05590 [SAR202 cluster bacterium Io17-Chloro-G7]|nr:MAG: hypothetical protein BZY75_05590 [SAR202 cluster bacterium Io17-Chloro-G7]